MVFLRREDDSMARNEAEGKVLEKIRDVEKEQGSFAEVGSELPPDYGHDSAKNPGVAGSKMPGGKKDRRETCGRRLQRGRETRAERVPRSWFGRRGRGALDRALARRAR
jgi:hypothetical protein